MAIDRQAAMRAVSDLLRALGYDPESDEGLLETPARVTAALADELLSGRGLDVRELLERDAAPLESGHPGGPVVLRDIDVATLCPHHLLPAFGAATVAYQPGRLILGLGALAKVVDSCARQLVLQEQIGERVVESLMTLGGAQGAYCRLSLWHSCLGIRGARQPRATVETTAARGTLSSSGSILEIESVRGTLRDRSPGLRSQCLASDPPFTR